MKSGQEEKEIAQSEPQVADRNTAARRYSSPLYAALLLVAAGVIVGLIFLARWIYHEANHNKTNGSSSQSQSKSGSKSAGGNQAKSKSGSSNKKTASSTPKSGQTVPNTGPGNVIGIFTFASFAAGALHYIVSLRRKTH